MATIPMKQAAQEILKEAGGPLRVKDITEKAIAGGKIKSSGKTPERTMAAVLSLDAKKDESAFLRTDRGTYGLRGRDRKGRKAVTTS